MNLYPYRPKMIGFVKAAKKNIKKIIWKMMITYKDWHDWLFQAFHTYKIAIRTLMCCALFTGIWNRCGYTFGNENPII